MHDARNWVFVRRGRRKRLRLWRRILTVIYKGDQFGNERGHIARDHMILVGGQKIGLHQNGVTIRLAGHVGVRWSHVDNDRLVGQAILSSDHGLRLVASWTNGI